MRVSSWMVSACKSRCNTHKSLIVCPVIFVFRLVNWAQLVICHDCNHCLVVEGGERWPYKHLLSFEISDSTKVFYCLLCKMSVTSILYFGNNSWKVSWWISHIHETSKSIVIYAKISPTDLHQYTNGYRKHSVLSAMKNKDLRYLRGGSERKWCWLGLFNRGWAISDLSMYVREH